MHKNYIYITHIKPSINKLFFIELKLNRNNCKHNVKTLLNPFKYSRKSKLTF